MKLGAAFILSGWLLVAQSLPVLADTPGVLINELAWAGSSEFGTNDEWIELYNPTLTDIDISGWQLTKWISGSNAREELMATLPAGSTITSGGYFLVARQLASSTLAITPDLSVGSAFVLSNSALQIKLYAGEFETAALIDTAGDKSAPDKLGGSNTSPKSSMERVGSSWQSATTRSNLNSVDFGTPKSANSIPPVEEEPEEELEEEPQGSQDASTPISKVVMLFADEIASDQVTLSWEIRNFSAKSFSIWQSSSGQLKGTRLKSFKSSEDTFIAKSLTPGQSYYFEVEAVDKDGQTISSNKLLVRTTWPKDLAVISEIWPSSSNGVSAFAEIATTQSKAFFKDWKLISAGQEIKIGQDVATQAATHLWIVTLPNNFLKSGESLDLVTPANEKIASLSLPAFSPNSGYALGFDNNYYTTIQATPGAKNQIVSSDMAETVAGEQTPELPPAGDLGLWLLIASMILSGGGLLVMTRNP